MSGNNKRKAIWFIALSAELLWLTSAANATPVANNNNWFTLMVNTGPNSIGIDTGQSFGFGDISVTSPTNQPITGTATAPDSSTYPIPFSPTLIRPNQFLGSTPFTPSLIGNWSVSFSDGVGSPVSQTLGFPTGTTQPTPFVFSVYVDGTNSLNPTFHWSTPAGYSDGGFGHVGPTIINAYSIAIYDNTLGPTAGVIQEIRLAPTVHEHTLTAADFTNGIPFDPTHQYTIGISAFQTRSGGTAGGINLYGQSNVFFDFNPSAVGGPALYLPQTLPDGSFKYDMAVKEGVTYYIDPSIAIGYDFQIGAGDPNFASVLLPTGIGDNLFDIFGFDALNNAFLLAADWLGGVVFDFGPGGVNRFRILGIEISAGLNPFDTTAFKTGLTFTADGEFTGTQTPISAVPEPSTIALFGAGLLFLIGFRTRKRKNA